MIFKFLVTYLHDADPFTVSISAENLEEAETLFWKWCEKHLSGQAGWQTQTTSTLSKIPSPSFEPGYCT